MSTSLVLLVTWIHLSDFYLMYIPFRKGMMHTERKNLLFGMPACGILSCVGSILVFFALLISNLLENVINASSRQENPARKQISIAIQTVNGQCVLKIGIFVPSVKIKSSESMRLIKFMFKSIR